MAPTEEGVLGFANSFGFLGSSSNAEGVFLRTDSNEVITGWGERFEIWFHEIQDMKALVRLWDAAKSLDGVVLSDYIEWSELDGGDRGFVSYRRQPFTTAKDFVIASKCDPERWARFQTGDLVQPALFALQFLVNEKLGKYGATPKLLWNRGKHPELKMCLAPTTLIAALWLQLASGIEGNRVYRRCEMCERWFEVAAGIREDAKFCQDSCKSKAYRARQKEARQLHSTGVRVGAIAEKLGSDLKTIKGWIK